ncbi:MAG: bifunctional DNA-formamidopyrimidine glycosylase/DNA-(apurinic or apyrimidinic site) lyase, partial [Desulfovibrio sp.]|nr:bifunctional DNA-formamidopyrimidine glycosylase/DNA-(apurinic or apyrimidinic site) lyase [Desulfovibrio sp.]
MPELPEVETVVRTLRPHVQGRTLLCARAVRPCVLKGSLPLERTEGAKVSLVRRRGKLAVLELDRE